MNLQAPSRLLISEFKQGAALDELELARKLSRGDHAAISRLVDVYHAPVYRFLKHLARHAEDAEDLAQQTLLRALRGAGRFDGRSSMRAWLMGIAFHEFTRWKRKRLW